MALIQSLSYMAGLTTRYKIHCIYPVFWRAFEPITSEIRSISAHNMTVNFGNTGVHPGAV